MHFLVTGANGFVGKQLCAELLRRGHSVRGALRTASALPQGVEPATVGDIDGKTDWRSALAGIEVVIHLAARVHVMKDNAADPLAEFLKVNQQGTENLAQQAAAAGVRRLVYASSIKVNGEQTHGEQRYSEADQPAPQDPYGVSKWQAEQTLHRIARETALEVAVVRPPLVYGPGVKGNFISLFGAVQRGLPLPLAAARNARSLVYVGNLVDALIACAQHPGAKGQTYLVRDGEDVSTAELVEKIAAALGKPNRAFYLPAGVLRAVATLLGRGAQVGRLFGSLRVDDTKIRMELGWKPPYTVEQGLQATAEWYRSVVKSA